MSVILRAQNLAKTFTGNERCILVLRDINLVVKTAETMSIRGESGSGKSTLLNILAGLEESDTGKVFWHTQPIEALSPTQRARQRGRLIGMIFQAYHLIQELDTLENVLFAARVLGPIDRSHRRRAVTLLERVGLAERLHSPPWQLSGGERQRVAVARALMNQPELLLADEPTGNLDPVAGQEVMDLLLEMSREHRAGLVLVTHNPAFAAATMVAYQLEDGLLHLQQRDTP